MGKIYIVLLAMQYFIASKGAAYFLTSHKIRKEKNPKGVGIVIWGHNYHSNKCPPLKITVSGALQTSHLFQLSYQIGHIRLTLQMMNLQFSQVHLACK